MRPDGLKSPRLPSLSLVAVLAALTGAFLTLPETPDVAGAAGKKQAGKHKGKNGAAEPRADKQGAHRRARLRRRLRPRPTYWGAWIGDQLTGTQPPWDMSAVHVFASLINKGPSLLSISSPFADCLGLGRCSFYAFPTQAMENIRSYGAFPFFNWGSQSTSSEPSLTTQMPAFQLADVLAGTYDAYIREFAAAAAAWGHPFFLRFNWEMNGNWFPWAESVNGNRPGEYNAVWRHVHRIFAEVGATNATWVWCPYVDEKRRFQPLARVYPGDPYVDWTCLDGFNWGRNPSNPHPWRNFNQIFGKTYRRIVKKIAPRKPMILGEIASTGGHRAKARWIRNMFRLLTTRYRRIRGLVWFDQIDRDINWPLETSRAATRAFSRGVRHRAYQPNIFAGADGGPIRPPGARR